MVPQLDSRLWFPDPSAALKGEPFPGLVAMGGDLRCERLVLAYRSGIFPWTVNPITWWSPDPRGIIELNRFHVSRSFARSLRQESRVVTFNRCFERVMTACAQAPGRARERWISAEFIRAYTALHRAGHAHSVECWRGDTLVGGVYGVATGGLFSGESMFHLETDASKVALWHLVQHLLERGFTLLDTQMVTPATAPMGAAEISRKEYLDRVRAAVQLPDRFGPVTGGISPYRLSRRPGGESPR